MHLGEQSQVPTQIGNQRAYSRKDNAQQARESLEEIDWNGSRRIHDRFLCIPSKHSAYERQRTE